MSSRRLPLAAALALGLGTALLGPAATAMHPADSSDRPLIAAQSRVALGQLPTAAVVGDGGVYDVVQRRDRVFALGDFEEIGRYSGAGRILDSGTGADLPAPTFGDGQVSVALADGHGGWYVAGDIRGGIVHVRADGSADPGFGVVVDGLVSAIALQGDTLYLGGLFSRVGEADRQNLAAVSASTGDLLPFSATATDRVAELAVDDQTLWVAHGATLSGLDPVSGAAQASTDLGDDVRGLALGDDVVYAGTTELEAFDPATAEPIDGFSATVSDGTVHTLLLDGDRLYVGTDGTDGESKLVAVDAATGAPDTSFAPEVVGGVASHGDPGGVFDLALDGDRLWVAGAFAEAGGEPAGGLAVLEAATGARADTAVPTLHRQVNTVELSGDAAYVGGHFYLDDPAHTTGLAALDAETLLPVPGFHADHQLREGDLTVAPNALYVAPTHVMGFGPGAQQPPFYSNTQTTVRAYDPLTGTRDQVRTHRVRNLTGVTTIGNSLVVAQRLQNDVRFPRNRVTVYTASGRKAWSFPVPLRGYITQLATVRGDLLVAGSFKRSAPDGGPRNTAMIRLDPKTGERRSWFDPKIDGPVYDVAVKGRAIFASGLFTEVHRGYDQDRPGLTRMTAGSVKSEEFVPQGRRANVFSRSRAIGDLLWVDSYPRRFLDAETGAKVPDPTGGVLKRSWTSAATGDRDSLVVAGQGYEGLAGEGAESIGWVVKVAP